VSTLSRTSSRESIENHPLRHVSEICSIGSMLFGVAYLEQMVLRATDLLGFDYGLIARPLSEDPRMVRTDVLVAGGQVQEPLSYPLEGTPCENVYDGNLVCVYADDVDRLFPDDKLLADMGVASYIGAPLLAPDRTLLGVFVLMHSKALESRSPMEGIVEYLAIRAGMELVRESMWADRLEHEETLSREKRLASLGQVVSVVAHDFNNLLAGLMGHAELLQLKLAENEDVQHNIDGILQATHRAEETTKQLLNFSNSAKPGDGVAHVNTILEELQQFSQHSFGSDIEVSISASSDEYFVAMEENHLHQMLLNLITNAKDAMPDGGGTIQLRVLGDRQMQRSAISQLPADKFIVLQVEDNGLGIDAAIQDRIFDPFFSTKSTDRGTGLGLASVHRLVTACGGYIDLDSTPGKGTTFSLVLPKAAETKQASSEQGASLPVSTTKRILVAEDDTAIAAALHEYLELKGFSVLLATNGDQAFDFYKQSIQADDPFDLVITDLEMPGCSGTELLEKVWELNPVANAIISTGDPSSLERSPAVQPQLCHVIQKPYRFQDFVALIQSVLESSGESRA